MKIKLDHFDGENRLQRCIRKASTLAAMKLLCLTIITPDYRDLQRYTYISRGRRKFKRGDQCKHHDEREVGIGR